MLTSQKRYYRFLRWIIKLKLRFSVKIEVIGLEHIPKKGPAILVSNHRSGIDPSIIGAVVPRYIAWVTASYMKKVPFMAWIIKKTGMVLVEVNGIISPSSLKSAFQVLDRGEILGIFPEGEDYIFTNDFKAALGSFYPGFSRIAFLKQVPIIPMMICPVKEVLVPIKIPPEVRDDIGQYHDLESIKNTVKYKELRVVIGKAVHCPTNPDLSPRTMADKLLHLVRDSMLRIDAKYRT